MLQYGRVNVQYLFLRKNIKCIFSTCILSSRNIASVGSIEYAIYPQTPKPEPVRYKPAHAGNMNGLISKIIQ
jgi:hypothetical protein